MNHLASVSLRQISLLDGTSGFEPFGPGWACQTTCVGRVYRWSTLRQVCRSTGAVRARIERVHGVQTTRAWACLWARRTLDRREVEGLDDPPDAVAGVEFLRRKNFPMMVVVGSGRCAA